MNGKSALPLSGIRVLDLSRLLPGPLLGRLLAQLGAGVVKVEDPETGDYLRYVAPLIGEPETSAQFVGLNFSKRALALDLRRPEGREIFLRLLPRYDVVLESFRPGVLQRMGLGYEELRRCNPRIILCSITGYGQTGPDAAKAGHDLNFMARAGVLAMARPVDGVPPVLPIQLGDIGGGTLAGLSAVLAALFQRERSGQGTWLDVAMAQGTLLFLAMALGKYQALPRMPAPGSDELIGGIALYDVYRCQDGKCLTIAALEPKFWLKLCAALGLPTPPATAPWQSGDGLKEKLRETLLTRTRDDWITRLAPLDACVEPVREPLEMINDPQFREAGAFVEVPVPGGQPLVIPGLPWRWRDQPGAPLTPAPRLGEHSREILREIGITEDAFARLREQRIVKEDQP